MKTTHSFKAGDKRTNNTEYNSNFRLFKKINDNKNGTRHQLAAV